MDARTLTAQTEAGRLLPKYDHVVTDRRAEPHKIFNAYAVIHRPAVAAAMAAKDAEIAKLRKMLGYFMTDEVRAALSHTDKPEDEK